MGNGLRFPMFKLSVCFFTRIPPYMALNHLKPGESENFLDILDDSHSVRMLTQLLALLTGSLHLRATWSSRANSFSWSLWPIPNSASLCSPISHNLISQIRENNPAGWPMVGLLISKEWKNHALLGKWQMVKEQSEYTCAVLFNWLSQCKQKLGQFSEDPSKFVEGFHDLALIHDLT